MNTIYTCHKHGNILAKQLKEFYKQKKLVDITLIAVLDGTTVEAHRNVLSAWSAYFKDALSQSNSVEIKLENMNGKVLNLLVDFMYSGSIKIDRENLKDILLAADFFKINILSEFCFAFIKKHLLLDYNNCLDFFFFADKHSFLKLKRKSQTFAYHNLDRVCTEEAFLLLNEQQLNNLFSDDDIHRGPQGELFDSLMAWYRRDKEYRGDLMCGLLSKLVDFEFLEGRPVILEWHLPAEKIITQIQKIVLIEKVVSKLFVHIFNPKLNSWSHKELKRSEIENKRYYAIAGFNNNIIFSGGEDENCQSCVHVNCLNLQTMQFSPICPMGKTRSRHIMAQVNENLYVFGGLFNSSTIETYNVRKGTWQKKTSFNDSGLVIASAVLNGILYVAYERRNWLNYYNPRADKWAWTTTWEKQVVITSMAAVNDFLYVLGYDRDWGDLDEVSACIQRYDQRYDTWAEIESPNMLRYWISCTSWNDHLVISAFSNNMIEFHEYDPLAEEWKSSIPDFELSRYSKIQYFSSIKEITINS